MAIKYVYVGYLLWTHFDVPMHEAIAAFCRPAKCPLFVFPAFRFSVSRRQHEDNQTSDSQRLV